MCTRAGTTAANVTKYSAKNLVVNNEYAFRITAVNAEGESEPLEGSETVKPSIKRGNDVFNIYESLLTLLIS